MQDKLIITIGREYGSGGRTIGKKLADKLSIPFYDHELIAQAAAESGFREDMFERLEQRETNSFLYSLAMFGTAGYNRVNMADKLFKAQSDVILKAAKSGSCVIVGRCADYILRNIEDRVDIFICSTTAARLERSRTYPEYQEKGNLQEKKLEEMDKRRAAYYNYYTGQKWGDSRHYDLCINSGRLGIDHSVNLILDYMKEMVEADNQG